MQENRFSYLLVALAIFIVALPVAKDLGLFSEQVARYLAVPSLLTIGIWSLRGTGRLFTIGMFLAIAGIVLSITSQARGDDVLYIVAQTMLFAFLGLATYSDLRQVAVSDEISMNRITGAVCVYLMLGVMWSIAYAVLEFSHPGSFGGLSDVVLSVWSQDWLYFSFVTITTLGYGDILPLSATARSLALMEAIAGQFYIAVLVAGLVSGYISARQEQNNQG